MEDFRTLAEEIGLVGVTRNDTIRLIDDYLDSHKQKSIIFLYYGIANERPINDYDELASILRSTPGNLRKYHKKILKKLKTKFSLAARLTQ